MTPPIVQTAPTQPAEIAQLLDEHHLVVLGPPATRRRFARTLEAGLESIPGATIRSVEGREMHDLASACRTFAGQLPADEPIATDTLAGLIERLRYPRDDRREYLIWHDADHLLECDVNAFAAVVHALLSVAAEQEYISADVLVLQRCILLGGPKLGAYAESEAGQFRAWDEDRSETFGPDVYACVTRPPVLTYRIGG